MVPGLYASSERNLGDNTVTNRCTSVGYTYPGLLVVGPCLLVVGPCLLVVFIGTLLVAFTGSQTLFTGSFTGSLYWYFTGSVYW